jgi:hypothetical protein
MLPIVLDPIVDHLMPADSPIRARIAELAVLQAGVTDDMRREAIIAAHQPGADPRLRVELAAAREEVVNLSFHAENFVLSLFENVELTVEQPFVEKVNLQDQSLVVFETHTHGEAPRQSFSTPKDIDRYNLDRYATGIIDYPSEHGIMGRIDVSDQINKDMIRAWNNQINDTLDPLLSAGLGAFVDGETYVLDSRIISGTRPTTNVLSNTGEGAFTWTIYQDIVDHFDRLGLELVTVRMNPAVKRDTWAWQHLVSTTGSGSQDGSEMITTKVKEGIIESGSPRGQLLGRTPTYILDPTYPLKKLQLFARAKAGKFYSKPHLDLVMDFDEQQMLINGSGSNVRGVQKSGYWLGLIYGPDVLNYAEMTFNN